ncbi:MAG: hypothetical protein HY689_13880 [Chloroflexi bacterium]|nr:hypothetical protein [Chloroflexota bacterium]
MLRTCAHIKTSGQPCGAPPLRDGPFCFWHAPDKAEEVVEAQRLGGLRRKREKTIAAAYVLEGLRDVEQVRRVLEIALVDTLSLDNGVPRNRTLVSIAQAGLKAMEVGELEERLAALEAAVKSRTPAPVFDVEME